MYSQVHILQIHKMHYIWKQYFADWLHITKTLIFIHEQQSQNICKILFVNECLTCMKHAWPSHTSKFSMNMHWQNLSVHSEYSSTIQIGFWCLVQCSKWYFQLMLMVWSMLCWAKTARSKSKHSRKPNHNTKIVGKFNFITHV
jgi:hypothetical protein